MKKALKYVCNAVYTKHEGMELELLIAILPDNNGSLYGICFHLWYVDTKTYQLWNNLDHLILVQNLWVPSSQHSSCIKKNIAVKNILVGSLTVCLKRKGLDHMKHPTLPEGAAIYKIPNIFNKVIWPSILSKRSKIFIQVILKGSVKQSWDWYRSVV